MSVVAVADRSSMLRPATDFVFYALLRGL